MQTKYSPAVSHASLLATGLLECSFSAADLASRAMTHDARDQEASFYYELFRQRLWVVLEDLPDTRKDIATAIGVSPQSLSNYVNDTETPKLHTLAKLCLRYRVSAAWLLLGDKADLPFAKAENWARAVEDRLAASRAAPAPAGEAPRAKAKGTKHRISRAS